VIKNGLGDLAARESLGYPLARRLIQFAERAQADGAAKDVDQSVLGASDRVVRLGSSPGVDGPLVGQLGDFGTELAEQAGLLSV
jgi:hypothetical protein